MRIEDIKNAPNSKKSIHQSKNSSN